MVKKMDKGGKWMWQGGQGPTCHDDRPHRRCPMCQVARPHHRSMGAAPQALPCVDLSWFASMVMMEWSWIHGSNVMDLQPSNRPPNQFTYQILTCADFTTTFGSQPRPYDRKAVKSRAAGAPTMSPGAQVTSTALLDIYKYPPCSNRPWRAINSSVRRHL